MTEIDSPTTVSSDLLQRLEARAAAVCSRLAGICEGSASFAAELQQKFYEAVRDIERVSIEQLPSSSGAFKVLGGCLTISAEPVARLLNVVLQDIGNLSADMSCLAAEDFPELLERVMVDYMLHELRHRTQGVGEYGTVGVLKAVAGPVAMAEMDLLADRDAAFAYAAVYCEDQSRESFLEAFREALFLSSAYFFKVFPIEAARPDKIARALGILLMAARLSNIDFSRCVQEDHLLPLDAPLIVKLSSDRKSLAVFRAEPSFRLVSAANDAHANSNEIQALISDVTFGNIDSALLRSVRLMERLNLMG